MERGFKTRCEEMSRSLRTELGLDPFAPLSAETWRRTWEFISGRLKALV